MTKKTEAQIQREIQEYVRSKKGKLVKTQGVEVGTPDLMGSVRVKGIFYPLAIEVKKPDTLDEVVAIQEYRLREWWHQGWIALAVSSVEEFKSEFYSHTGVDLDD